ncbi:response regulator [Hyalangium gracile]|uniref:response regulator n=1 Tax=Hyalangium gracile TaxID=394092 RepID=UPI001CCC4649|nr:response regulator [Hyalangium gracile]
MTRVLVVDDETAIVDALEDILSMEGYEVMSAFNGQEGLMRMSERTPDLVLLDLMMPVMSGAQLLGRIRQDPKLRDIPVVVMSAGRIAEEERRNASAVLPKPFELDALLDTLARYLRPQAGQSP